MKTEPVFIYLSTHLIRRCHDHIASSQNKTSLNHKGLSAYFQRVHGLFVCHSHVVNITGVRHLLDVYAGSLFNSG